MTEGSGGERVAGFSEVFAVGEFRAVWMAHALSVAGDQLARVALSVLVFARTGSPAWTAVTYAATFLPDLAGGPLLAGAADRFSRRLVMVVADVIRAVVVAAMAVPGLPVPAVVVLLVAAQLFASPFTAARGAILPSVLAGDRLVVGTVVMSTTYQLALVAGFGGGAAVVVALGTRNALLADAATFVCSALLIGFGLRAHHPPAAAGTGARPGWWRRLRAGWRAVVGDRRLRSLVGLACVCGAYVVPEALAVPYAAQIRASTVAVGWLLAANPAGTVAGVLIVKAVRPAWRPRLFAPLALATCAVLIPMAWAPSLPVAVGLLVASGVASAYNSASAAEFARTAPEQARGQALGLAASAIRVAQGVGVVAAGVLADVLPAGLTIAVFAGLGVVVALLAGWAWVRAARPAPPAGGASRWWVTSSRRA